jgi:hypothetical protein
MESNERSVVFFHRPGFGLDQADAALRQSKLTVLREGETVAVFWDEQSPRLFVRFVQGEGVRKDAVKISRGTLLAGLMNGFDSAFEISFRDLDEVLDEINTLIEVQTILREATDGVVARSWNDELSGPE